MSKERRLEPQITVGLLTDETGFPLRAGAFEGNKAETATMIPMINDFMDAYDLDDVVVVADAGMISAANKQALERAGLSYVLGSRTSLVPHVISSWRDSHPESPTCPTPTPRQSSAPTTACTTSRSPLRMSKSDLRARPIYHHLRQSIEAHLTIVTAALAMARWLETTTGWSIRRLITTARRYRSITINIAGHTLTAADPLPPDLTQALHNIHHDTK